MIANGVCVRYAQIWVDVSVFWDYDFMPSNANKNPESIIYNYVFRKKSRFGKALSFLLLFKFLEYYLLFMCKGVLGQCLSQSQCFQLLLIVESDHFLLVLLLNLCKID